VPLPRADVLQAGEGPRPGDCYVRATPDTVSWGRLPHRASTPQASVTPGRTVTVDTVSHEGVLEDQGRDPRSFFRAHGVDDALVLHDAVDIAASALPHDAADGPHVVNHPIAVEGAHPGDVIVIEVVSLLQRVPYGVISNRHGRGTLPDELPAGASPVSQFCSVDNGCGVLDDGEGHVARFPLQPFLGLVAVASDDDEAPHSVPPGRYGGNLDVRDLGVGSRLYLPVQLDGALVSIGDPHYAQGHGEVALTAFEAPLRATLRFDVLPAEAVAELTHLAGPWGESGDHWIAIGLDRDLNVAMRNATRAALATVVEKTGMRRDAAYAYLSAAADFHVSQFVDGVVGVHATIDRRHFGAAP